ncbi:MAG TPA: hypothetical protein PKZ22_15450 [Accumulibacter sp.]|nr:hypothetical protein [Accumulibacter sp.]
MAAYIKVSALVVVVVVVVAVGGNDEWRYVEFVVRVLGNSRRVCRDLGAVVKLNRRVRAYLLSFWFALGSVVLPIREARAIVPFVSVAIAALGAGGSIITADILATTASALVGGTIVALAITPKNLGDEPSMTRIPLTTSPASSSAMPAPSVPSSATQSTSTKYNGIGGYIYDTATDACNSSVAVYNETCTCTGSICMRSSGNSLIVFSLTTTICPSGYTASGSSCVLNNARVAASDGNYDLVRSGSTLSDPGVSGEKDAKPNNVAVSSGSGKIWGTNSAGQNFVTTITPTSDGGSQIQTQTQISGGYVNTSTVVVGANGAVDSSTSSSATGSISAAADAATAPTVTQSSTNAQAIQFPDDYARTGEVARAAQTVVTSVDRIHTDLTSTTEVSDPSADTSAFSEAFFKGTFTGVLSWRLPAHTSTCATSSFEWIGKTYAINQHCALMDDYKSEISAASVLMFTILALFIVLKA